MLINVIIVLPFVRYTYVLESLSGFRANLDPTVFVADLSGQSNAVNVSRSEHTRDESLSFCLRLIY